MGVPRNHPVVIWLVVWNIFYFSIQLGIIIPSDFHIFQRGRSTTSSDRIETMNSYWNNYGDDWGSPMTSGKPAPRLPWRERRGTRSNDAQFLPAPRETLSTNCPMDPHFLLVGGDWNMAGLFSISYMGCHPSNWRAHIFQRGRSTTNQLDFDVFFRLGDDHFESYHVIHIYDLLMLFISNNRICGPPDKIIGPYRGGFFCCKCLRWNLDSQHFISEDMIVAYKYIVAIFVDHIFMISIDVLHCMRHSPDPPFLRIFKLHPQLFQVKSPFFQVESPFFQVESPFFITCSPLKTYRRPWRKLKRCSLRSRGKKKHAFAGANDESSSINFGYLTGIAYEKKKLYFVWSPPWHLYIHFLTGKSSGILSDISSGILSGISSGICSGISSGILSGKSSGILSGISSGILSDISSGILSGISSGILSDISSGILSDLPSGISSGILFGRWGLAVPTGIWSSRLRSGSAHWDLELAVEVRQCPLRPGSRGWGPAVPTAICNSWLRSGSAHWDLELAVEVRLCPLGSGLRGGWGGGGGEELC